MPISGPHPAATDDTGAFQRFYAGSAADETRPGLVYRLLVGWWRDRDKGFTKAKSS